MQNRKSSYVVTKSLSHEFVDLRRDGRIYRTGNLYQSANWLDAVAKGNGYRYMGVRTRCRNGDMTGLYYTVRKGPLHLVGSPLPASFCDHIPPFVNGSIPTQQITKLILSQMRFLARQGYDYVEARMPDTFLPADPILTSPRIEVRRVGTLILDLTRGEKTLWKNMQGRSRNMIRKATKNGVKIRPLDSKPETVDAFYEMLRNTYARQGLPVPHRQTLYAELVKRLNESDHVFLAGAEVDGRVEAIGIFPHDKQNIYFMSGTSNRKAMQLGANNLMQWEVIRLGIAKGLQTYDLGGTGVAAIDRFKKSIGGIPVHYNRIVWMSPFGKLVYTIRMNVHSLMARYRFR